MIAIEHGCPDTIPAACACGQDLDCTHREHCPRCGATLAQSA